MTKNIETRVTSHRTLASDHANRVKQSPRYLVVRQFKTTLGVLAGRSSS